MAGLGATAPKFLLPGVSILEVREHGGQADGRRYVMHVMQEDRVLGSDTCCRGKQSRAVDQAPS